MVCFFQFIVKRRTNIRYRNSGLFTFPRSIRQILLAPPVREEGTVSRIDPDSDPT